MIGDDLSRVLADPTTLAWPFIILAGWFDASRSDVQLPVFDVTAHRVAMHARNRERSAAAVRSEAVTSPDEALQEQPLPQRRLRPSEEAKRRQELDGKTEKA